MHDFATFLASIPPQWEAHGLTPPTGLYCRQAKLHVYSKYLSMQYWYHLVSYDDQFYFIGTYYQSLTEMTHVGDLALASYQTRYQFKYLHVLQLTECLLEAEVCCVYMVSTKVPMDGRRGQEHHIRAQIVPAHLAEVTDATWHSRFHGNAVPCNSKTCHIS